MEGALDETSWTKAHGLEAIGLAIYLATNETSPKFQRVEYMMSLSGTGTCGEADFRCRGSGNARLPARMAGAIRPRNIDMV